MRLHPVPAPALAAAALCAGGALAAPAMNPLSDAELSDVGGAGIAFNLVGFSLEGPLTLTYTQPGSGASLWLGALSLARSDDPAATFSDPYTLRVLRRDGLPDLIHLAEPLNAAGLLRWRFAADWGVNADGIAFQGGALVVQDLVTQGGSLSLAPPATPGVEGIAFGVALKADIGALLLRPRGRGDMTTGVDAAEQLKFAGVHLGAAAADGTPLGTPWALADATTQPGILNAVTGADGQPALHLGIDWPRDGTQAAVGTLAIDSIVFRSESLPGGAMDLGSSRIGTIQLQYLDLKFRPGP